MGEWSKDSQYHIYKDLNIPMSIVVDLADKDYKETISYLLKSDLHGVKVNTPVTELVLDNQCSLVHERGELFKHSSFDSYEELLSQFFNSSMYGKLSNEMLSVLREIFLFARQNTSYLSKEFDDKFIYLLSHAKPYKDSKMELPLNKIPDKMVLYRGENKYSQHNGLSWTTDKHIASLFAHDYDKPVILTKEFSKNQILSVYKDDFNEKEVLVNCKG